MYCGSKGKPKANTNIWFQVDYILKEIMDDRFKNAIKRPADLAIANDGTTFIVSVTESKFHILKLDGAHTKTNAQING